MTLPIIDSAASAVYASLITLTWGTSSVARYCRWSDDITIGSETFIAEPSFSWQFDKPLGAGTDDSPVIIQMVDTRQPMDTNSQIWPHSPILVKIEEICPSDLSTRVEIFRGRISLTTVKPGGLQGIVKSTVTGVKSQLMGDLGIQSLTTCIWLFGDRNNSPCGKLLDPITINATVAALYDSSLNNRITLNFVGATPLENQRWKGGNIEYDGLKITIRRSLNDSTGRFDLREMIPPVWLGKTIILTPGCDKQIATCKYWENENRFAGYGLAMPLRNPLFEQ